jgi:tRNA(Ile)-lysidine synthase
MVSRQMPGKTVELPGEIEAVRRTGKLLIRIHTSVKGGVEDFGVLEIPGPGIYEFGVFVLEITAVEGPGSPDGETAGPREVFMDADSVKWPLHVRSWRPGDRFRPLGMKGSKKLQDFFTDSKVPRAERSAIPILCDREKIVWVAGLRLDNRVRTRPETRRLVAARLKKSGASGPV